MRVPTYTAQVQSNRAGGGTFTTASLSSSAMQAPGRALRNIGNDLFEIGMKKMQIQAEGQLDAASMKLKTELEEIYKDGMMQADPIQAETDTISAMRTKVKEYSSGTKLGDDNKPLLTSRAAKRAMQSAAADILFSYETDFRRKNVTRIVEYKKGTLTRQVDTAVQTITNPGASDSDRAQAFTDIFGIGEKPGFLAAAKIDGTINDNGFMTRVDDTANQIVEGTAVRLMQSSDSATAVAMEIVNEQSKDLMINSALSMMDIEDKTKLFSDLITLGNKIDTERREAKEAAEKKTEDDRMRQYKSIINARTDDELIKAKQTYQALLDMDWFDPQQRKHAEAILGIERGQTRDDNQENDRGALRQLNLADQQGILSINLVESLSEGLTTSTYEKYLGLVENDRKDGRTAALKLIANETGYNELRADGLLGSAADRIYYRSEQELNKFFRDNPTATNADIVKEAGEINKRNKVEYIEVLTAGAIQYLENNSLLKGKTQFSFDPERPVSSALESLKAMTLDVMPATSKAPIVLELKNLQKLGVK